MSSLSIPVVDLADFYKDPEANKLFISTLGKAFEEVGFVAVKNHRLDDELVSSLYKQCQSFFELPDEIKKKYEIEGLAGQRGYTGKGKEHAKGRNTGDLKEFYHIGQEVTDNDPVASQYPANIWPDETEQFRKYTLEAYRKLEHTGKDLLQAIAVFLNLPQNYFEKDVHNGNSILRAIHYYPIENPADVPADAVRAAQHEDINLITLLMGASAEGLEILNNQGHWVAVTALPGQIVVNVGDMLSRLTNNRLKSTTHRVVNPPKEKMHLSRYSIPFFMHPKPSMDLSCLNSCIDENHPKKFADTTAGEYLTERLRELGLLK